jgi:hypothetical protein
VVRLERHQFERANRAIESAIVFRRLRNCLPAGENLVVNYKSPKDVYSNSKGIDA